MSAIPSLPITIDDHEAVNTYVEHVRGRATAHTDDATELMAQCAAAERRLEALGVAMSRRIGCRLTRVSGAPVSGAFQKLASRRMTSRAEFRRGGKHWLLTSYTVEQSWSRISESTRLLIPAQLREPILRHVCGDVQWIGAGA